MREDGEERGQGSGEEVGEREDFDDREGRDGVEGRVGMCAHKIDRESKGRNDSQTQFTRDRRESMKNGGGVLDRE